VVSYNIQYGQKLAQAVADLRNAAQLDDIDVLLLQEMSTAGVDSIARALSFNYVYYPAYIHPQRGHLFGNAVLTPWPITGKRVLTLPHGNPFTADQRIAVAADLKVGAAPLRAVSVHTSTLVLAQDRRMEQFQAIIDGLGGVDGPIIIGGDFNTATEYEVKLAQRLFRHAGFRRVRLPQGPTLDRPLLRLGGWSPVMDHIFFRQLEMGDTGTIKEALASDHWPIWATFSWPEKEH
jgi:endonuclease/exonuclease/phosphatase family metal-dependent hydrolase